MNMKDCWAKTNTPSESSLQKSILKYLNSLEGCTAENVSGNSQQSGRPDINGVYNGRNFRMELKVLGNKPTKKQFLNLLKWFKSGSAICVAYSLDDAKKFINFLPHGIPWQNIRGSYSAFGYYIYDGGKTDGFFSNYKKLYLQD